MYSAAQLRRIREIMVKHLKKEATSLKIRNTLAKKKLKMEDLTDEKMIDLLKECMIMDDILLEIEHEQQEEKQHDEERLKQLRALPSGTSIIFRLVRGKAFLEYLDPHKFAKKKFIFYVTFMKQRFASRPIPVSPDPIIQAEFNFELISSNGFTDLISLSKNNSPLDLVVTLYDTETTERELISLKHIEWRFVLVFGNVSLNAEMFSVPQKTKVSAGILEIELDLAFGPGVKEEKSMYLLPEKLLNEQLAEEKRRINYEKLKVYDYSSNWWQEYKNIRGGFDKRAVKIYVEDQDGVLQPAFVMVAPLIIRGIDSPHHAARFVSLIPFKKEETPGGDRKEMWHNFNVFLSKGSGDVEDHAVLLCSLLLGFGLDAYVCVGISGEGPHYWVMTRSYNEGGVKATYWESLTGMKYEQADPRVHYLYRRIHCIFNDQSFYGNIQENDSGFYTNLNINDETLWKRYETEYIKILKTTQALTTFLPAELDNTPHEIALEKELRKFILQFRAENDMGTKFDEKLSYVLTTALANYEHEKLSGGQTFGTEEFQAAIRNLVPDNHTFKAFPIQFTSKDIRKIITTLKNTTMAVEIIRARGDSVHHSLRVRIVSYPEKICAVWVIIAVRFLSLG